MDFLQKLKIEETAKCICVVGSGGKTSLLYYLAKCYQKQEKTVLLTTTTKMYLPKENAVLSGDALEIQQKLKQWGFVVAGIPCADGKMTGLPKQIWNKVFSMADIVLVEADGAKRLPLKIPNHTEPVLPKKCDFLVTVIGLSCLGKPLVQVCHRWEITSVFGYDANTIVTEEVAADILQKGYQSYWKKYVGCVFANQVDCVNEKQAKHFGELLPVPYVWGSLQNKSEGKTNDETI